MRGVRTVRRWIRWGLVLALALGLAPIAPAAAQGGEDEFIARLLAQMPPEAKVGQLFLVTLPGPIARSDHPLRSLLTEQRIGGVVLSPDQGNFTNLGDTPSELLSITLSLQQQAATLNPFIPLFIGVRQQGDGPPFSAWTRGAMPLPSPLALGATWDPERVQAVGQALGEELQAVGVNLLLGPPLDVLLEPRPEIGDAGVQTFGGDPQWVSRIARAYLSGLMAGSEGRLLIAPGSFPGEGRAYGWSERTAVLTKEDLVAFDLVPFLELMRTPTETGRPLVRAVQVSLMRIRGFGGSAQEWTRPLAVDGNALGTLLTLPEIKTWRDRGGVLLSPPLGHPVLRAEYADEQGEIDFRRAALDAFMAGNDLIWLGDLHANALEAARRATEVIRFFSEKYSTDLAFQNLVNSAVARILRLKYALYPGFAAGVVFPNPQQLRQAVGTPAHLQVVRQALESAVVRLYSAGSNPPPIPQPGEPILILVDGRRVRACAACPEQPLLPAETLTQALQTASGGALDPAQISVRSFAEAMAFFSRAPEAPDLRPDFERAAWIVIAALDEHPADPASSLPHLLLGERAELLGGKKVVFWGFGALYPLTAREIARLSRYEAIWTHIPPAVEIMARVLFGTLTPRSRPPLSIPTLGYHLADRVRPDPAQVIPLGVGPREGTSPGTPTPVAVQVGQTLRVWAGPIRDRDGFLVPDGIPVWFTGIYTDQGSIGPFIARTRDGFAEVDIPLDREGSLEIRAVSEPARLSYRLQIQIEKNRPGRIATIVPPTPTRSPEPTVLPTPKPWPTLTPRAPGFATLRLSLTGWQAFGWSHMLILGFSVLIFALGWRRGPDWAWRSTLLGWIAGWITYTLLIVGGQILSVPEARALSPIASGAAVLLIGGLAMGMPTKGD
ncbi:glycoside hydrolase family 3 N-terminal domain-containing protein [Thermoflexus sp.]|uniref:glycoside hydrolase family 3 N-terminal domain-containing protein n=1 Tax=Thermoflexus sp. TaxID=1969742 RepID=UPI0035E4234F